MKKKTLNVEKGHLKKSLPASDKEFEKELFIALSPEIFFNNENKLQNLRKKYKKEIEKIKIDIPAIIKRAETIRARQKK